MNLEKLVPPLDLCKLIPDGEFADSVFAWWQITPFEEWQVVVRSTLTTIPAPTLQEIMAELSLCDEYVDTGWFCMVGDPGHWSIGNCESDLYVKNGTENDRPEVAALKVWLKLKGIDCEHKRS